MRWASLLLLCCACSACAPSACAKREAAARDAGAAVAAAVDGAIEANVEQRASDGVRPVLENVGAADARAARLCRAVHGLVVERKGACCGEQGLNSSPVEAACTSALSAVLKDKSVTLDEPALAACEAAQASELADCGWVRALAPVPAAACTTLLTGTLDDGARCRSSVECTSGLRCHGASLLDAGRCGPPRPLRSPCGGAVDALAIAVGQPAIDGAHPQCAHACVLGRCAAPAQASDACRSNAECGAGNRCDTGKCTVGLIALGGACTGSACVAGARCLAGRCAALARAGEPCRNDFDCARGGCVKTKDAAASTERAADDSGTCAMRCTSWHDASPP